MTLVCNVFNKNQFQYEINIAECDADCGDDIICGQWGAGKNGSKKKLSKKYCELKIKEHGMEVKKLMEKKIRKYKKLKSSNPCPSVCKVCVSITIRFTGNNSQIYNNQDLLILGALTCDDDAKFFQLGRNPTGNFVGICTRFCCLRINQLHRLRFIYFCNPQIMSSYPFLKWPSSSIHTEVVDLRNKNCSCCCPSVSTRFVSKGCSCGTTLCKKKCNREGYVAVNVRQSRNKQNNFCSPSFITVKIGQNTYGPIQLSQVKTQTIKCPPTAPWICKRSGNWYSNNNYTINIPNCNNISSNFSYHVKCCCTGKVKPTIGFLGDPKPNLPSQG